MQTAKRESTKLDVFCRTSGCCEGAEMTLQELEQVKQDLANGIIISRSQWVKVLDAAIEGAKVASYIQKASYHNTTYINCEFNIDSEDGDLVKAILREVSLADHED
jgi:hypothetical protein